MGRHKSKHRGRVNPKLEEEYVIHEHVVMDKIARAIEIERKKRRKRRKDVYTRTKEVDRSYG